MARVSPGTRDRSDRAQAARALRRDPLWGTVTRGDWPHRSSGTPALRQWRHAAGQATVEYLVTAGVLVLAGLGFSARLLPALRGMLWQVAHVIRGIAP